MAFSGVIPLACNSACNSAWLIFEMNSSMTLCVGKKSSVRLKKKY